jgi:hypothetical protein
MDHEKRTEENISTEAQEKLLATGPANAMSADNKSTQPKSDDFRVQRLLKHHEYVMENKSYSVSRFDILVISISSGGLYVIFETLKFYRDAAQYGKTYSSDLLNITGLVFTVSIILNFFSQWTAFRANKNEEKWVNLEIRREKKVKNAQKDEADLNEQELSDEYTRWSTRYNKVTGFLNVLSAVVMLAGIVMLALFNF